MINSFREFRFNYTKIKMFFGTIKLYKNWMDVFMTYMRFKDKNIFYLRNGTVFSGKTGATVLEVINEIYLKKTYEPLFNSIKENSTVIDIGANVGIFSVLAAKSAPGVKVYSYEPFVDNFYELNRNIQVNTLSDKIKSFKLAVAKKAGKRTLYLDPNNVGNNTLYKDKEENNNNKQMTIECTTLADIFKKNKIETCDFLKFDCEGAEFEIILNSPDKLLDKVKTITLEFHENLSGIPAENLVEFLESKGFITQMTDKNGGVGYIYARNKKYEEKNTSDSTLVRSS